jgi:hypothetical protein
MKEKINSKIDEYIAKNNIEFIDFGASKGGSINLAKKYFCKFSGKGVGIDIDPEKIDIMKKAGYDAFCEDVVSLSLKEKVRFIVMSHFLEHIDGFENSKKCLESAANNSTEFFYIQQPYFDADGYLFSKKLKFFWSHWGGHPNRIGVLDFYKILEELKLSEKIDRYAIYGYNEIKSSKDGKLLPLSASADQHHYDINVHPKKECSIEFGNEIDIFQELRVLATTDPKIDYGELEKSFKWNKKIYDSGSR